MRTKLLISMTALALAAFPFAAQAQGTVRGAQEGAEAGGRHRKREEKQACVLRSLLEPDEKMEDTERQARRDVRRESERVVVHPGRKR